jgi:hypothetical protein
VPLQSTKHLATQQPGQIGQPQQGDGLAGAGGADHGHGLAAQLGRRDHIAALAPAGQVAVKSDPERRSVELVIAGAGDQPRCLAVARALVDALAAAHEGAPLGAAGGPFGVPHRQGGGQQPDRGGQPHLGRDQVPEELPDGDAGAGWAEAEVQGHVLPEVLGHEHMPAQRLLGAGHGQYRADGDQRGEGEAPPVPAALEQDHRLPDQPGHDGQRREPDQQQHDQQQAVGGRLAGGTGDGVACQPPAGFLGSGRFTRHLRGG